MNIGFSMDTASALTLIFLVTLLVITVYAAFLIYHWYAFGLKKRVNTLATLIYLIGSGIFLLIMAAVIFTL